MSRTGPARTRTRTRINITALDYKQTNGDENITSLAQGNPNKDTRRN